MSKERLYLFDTTLRDGAQTNGVDFTLTGQAGAIAAHARRRSASTMSRAVIPAPIRPIPQFFSEEAQAFDHATLHRVRHDAAAGPLGLERSGARDGILEAKADAICFVAKSSAYQVRVALETTQ